MAARVVAGELYESITGQLFEIGRQLRQKGGYPYDSERLKQALQAAIEGRFSKLTHELYLTPAQRNGGTITGFDLDKHLRDEKLIDRTMSLEDEMVKGWIANPSTYPEEFKGKAVFLWKSQRSSSGNRGVAYLVWGGGRVVVHWRWLVYGWRGYYPVLLASS